MGIARQLLPLTDEGTYIDDSKRKTFANRSPTSIDDLKRKMFANRSPTNKIKIYVYVYVCVCMFEIANRFYVQIGACSAVFLLFNYSFKL